MNGSAKPASTETLAGIVRLIVESGIGETGLWDLLRSGLLEDLLRAYKAAGVTDRRLSREALGISHLLPPIPITLGIGEMEPGIKILQYLEGEFVSDRYNGLSNWLVTDLDWIPANSREINLHRFTVGASVSLLKLYEELPANYTAPSVVEFWETLIALHRAQRSGEEGNLVVSTTNEVVWNLFYVRDEVSSAGLLRVVFIYWDFAEERWVMGSFSTKLLHPGNPDVPVRSRVFSWAGPPEVQRLPFRCAS